jgi:hypothetical protein
VDEDVQDMLIFHVLSKEATGRRQKLEHILSIEYKVHDQIV